MAIMMGLLGPCLKYDGEVLPIRGIKGNPYVIRREFDAEYHEIVERQMYLPEELVNLLDLVVKRYT